MKLIFLIPLFVAACGGGFAPQHPSHVEVISTGQTADSSGQEQTDSLVFTKEELLGKFKPEQHKDFVRIKSAHTTKENTYLRRAAYEAFVQMHDAARSEGVVIRIISATRNFDDQKKIWEKKWLRDRYKGWADADKAKDILLYSSMPGTSRHHWGTDMDFNSVELSYFEQTEGKKLYAWLTKNAGSYGFVQTYTSKENGRTGYQEEKWHWSYLPLSEKMLQAYNANISYDDLKGFSGCETAKELRVIEDFVNGVGSSH
jgi:LAS superfamily LD-carboxypeptidase LdcB